MMRRTVFPRWLSALLLLGSGSFAAVAAETGPSVADRMLHQEQKQQQLRTTTLRVGEMLDAIVAEFDRNGITGEDADFLKAIRSVLGRLSEKEMDLVIDYLKKARAAGDDSASARQATAAFATQKAIITQLNELVSRYQRQQELNTLALRIKELAAKQSANMWLGVALAKATEGKGFNSFDESQKINLKFQQTEQGPMKDELQVLLRRLEKVAAEITDDAAADRPRAALARVSEGGLLTALDAAAEDLREDKLRLLSAVGHQKRARDEMREVARLLTLSTDRVEMLRQALQEVDRTLDQQRQLTADTRKATRRDEADKRSYDQAEVVDLTDLIRRDIDSLAPVAAEYLRGATDKMQEARSALGSDARPQQRIEAALPRQEEAILQLTQARQAIEEQLLEAEAAAQRPANRLEDLQRLQEQVRGLIKDQEALKHETSQTPAQELIAKAPKQGSLKDKSQELQARSAGQAPDAAESLGEAADQMQKAQNSLATRNNNAPAQQAALDALERAERQLGEEIQKLEQAQKDLEKLDDLLKRLAAVIEEQQKVQFATAAEALKSKHDPLPELSTQQAGLAQTTALLQHEAAAPAPSAASHLGRAHGLMTEAKASLDKPEPKPAGEHQAGALKELYLAKRELEKKIDELRAQLGLPSLASESLADAQKLIEEAQQRVGEALSELQQSPPGLMDSLQQQQRQIADSLGQMDQEMPQIAEAQRAAREAAEQLGRSNVPRAVQRMKAAREAMKQAGESSQGEPRQQLSSLGRQQADLQRLAEALAAAQEAAPASALQQAAQALQQAHTTIGPLTAGSLGPLPGQAQSALQSAQGSLSEGAAQAGAGQGMPSQINAASAAQALAQAQAALSMAQAGLSSGQGQGQQQGQGQGKGQGQGQGEGQAQSDGQGRGQPSPKGTGERGNWTGTGGADGRRNDVSGSSAFTGLPQRDRAAIQQSQGEKYPQEYGPLVEQYLKNLSDQTGPR
ncbi:MAG TPA: hypothetical protein VNO52_03490 [Methylomirabilota bacterium]|nr:hypothetical protein [Methylomirabilota bacterium]